MNPYLSSYKLYLLYDKLFRLIASSLAEGGKIFWIKGGCQIFGIKGGEEEIFALQKI